MALTNGQNNFWQIQTERSHSRIDDIATPEYIAKMMIELCELRDGESVLDPSLGGGVFYKNFPSTVRKFWTEIKNDRDFYTFPYFVDCIIGNPPYSQWNNWLKKTVNICDRFCYIMGVMNLTPKRLDTIDQAGFCLHTIKLLGIVPWPGNSWIVYFVKKSQVKVHPQFTWLRERVFYSLEEEEFLASNNITVRTKVRK